MSLLQRLKRLDPNNSQATADTGSVRSAPRVASVAAFTRSILADCRAPQFEKKRLVAALLEHQLTVNRCLGEPTNDAEQDIRALSLDADATKRAQRIPNLSLKYLVAFDELLRQSCRDKVAAHAAALQMHYTGVARGQRAALRDLCDAMTLAVQVGAALCLTVYRELDAERERHLNGHHADSCYCVSPASQSVLGEVLKRSTKRTVRCAVSAALMSNRPLVAYLSRQFTPQVVGRWWDEIHDGADGFALLGSLYQCLTDVDDSRESSRWVPDAFAAHVRLFASKGSCGVSAVSWIHEVSGKCSRLLSTAAPSTAWMPLDLLDECRRIVYVECVLPMRQALPSIISSAVSGGQVQVLAALVQLESLRGPSRDADNAIPSVDWLQSQVRSSVASSLRETFARSINANASQLHDATWCDTLVFLPGSRAAEVSAVLLRLLVNISEWVGQQRTVQSLLFPSKTPACSDFFGLMQAGAQLLQNGGKLVANMIHVGLASASKGCAPSEVVEVLELCCHWLMDKDVFVSCMLEYLEQRLLEAMPISDDMKEVELQVLCVLRQHTAIASNYGLELRKMDELLKDGSQQATIAERLNIKQRLHEALGFESALEVQLTVLRSQLWTAVPAAPLARFLPLDIQVAAKLAQDAYKKQWRGRVLAWSHGASRCCVEALFANNGKSKVELTVPLLGASVLSYFDLVRQVSVSAKELEDGVVASSESVSPQKAPHAAGCAGSSLFHVLMRRFVDIKLLQYNDVSASYSVNMGFTSKMRKVSLVPKMRVTALADAAVTLKPTVEQDAKLRRRTVIKAAIVRIMKSRRQCAHVALYDATSQQVQHQFLLTLPNFKDAVAELLDTDYLARSQENSSHYTYVA